MDQKERDELQRRLQAHIDSGNYRPLQPWQIDALHASLRAAAHSDGRGFIYDTQPFPDEPVVKPLQVDRAEFFGNEPAEPITFTVGAVFCGACDAELIDGQTHSCASGIYLLTSGEPLEFPATLKTCALCERRFTTGVDIAALIKDGQEVGPMCQCCSATFMFMASRPSAR